MQRRSSGSAEEDEIADTAVTDPGTPDLNHDEKRRSFTSAKYDLSRHSDTLDRRKVERPIASAQFLPNASTVLGLRHNAPEHVLVASQPDGIKMLEVRGRRQTRLQSPWSCSLLTLSVTALSLVLLFSVIHSFLTRQVDSKGCDMCYTREIIYFEFADFDTEHTRFATKYSLHLIREEGFDEDPKVHGLRNSLVWLTVSRSRALLSCSYREMLEAISKPGVLPLKLRSSTPAAFNKTQRP